MNDLGPRYIRLSPALRANAMQILLQDLTILLHLLIAAALVSDLITLDQMPALHSHPSYISRYEYAFSHHVEKLDETTNDDID